jgi:hypothetical protein
MQREFMPHTLFDKGISPSSWCDGNRESLYGESGPRPARLALI